MFTMQQILDALTRIDWGVVTGLIALLFTGFSLKVQHQHNILSIKPIAIFSVGDYENQLAVHLQNKGVGPLIIKKLSFVNEKGRRENSIIDLFGTEFENVVWDTFVDDIDGWAVLPNESKTLIRLNGDPSDQEFCLMRNKVRKVLSTIQAELIYLDIYGNKMPMKVRKLDFFARHLVKNQ